MQVTGLEPTRLMRHRHLKLALSVCRTSSASTKSKISCRGTSSASTKSKIWCNSATAVLKCISNKKQAVFLRLVLVQVTGLEPTRLMRHRHLKLALSVCGNAKHFRYHQIKDLVQFRHCCFKMYQQQKNKPYFYDLFWCR